MNTVYPPNSESITPPHSGPSLEELMARINKDDAPRWMVGKDGLDHGPFSGRELVAMIVKGDALGEHNLTNIDTGEQSRLSQYPLFSGFVGHYRDHTEEQTRKDQLARAVKAERFGNVAKVLIALGVVAVAATVVTIYLLSRKEQTDRLQSVEDLAALYERGEIQLEGTASVMRGGRSSKGRMRRAPGASGSAGASYEQAMNQAVDLGDISQADGASITLTNEQVASAINRRMGSIARCVSAELRSGQRPGKVGLDLVIAGSGNVLGVTVRAGSAEFRQCVATEVRNIKFPTSSAPRTNAGFAFTVN